MHGKRLIIATVHMKRDSEKRLIYVKRDVYEWKHACKSSLHTWKETDKRDLYTSKETYMHGQRLITTHNKRN